MSLLKYGSVTPPKSVRVARVRVAMNLPVVACDAQKLHNRPDHYILGFGFSRHFMADTNRIESEQ